MIIETTIKPIDSNRTSYIVRVIVNDSVTIVRSSVNTSLQTAARLVLDDIKGMALEMEDNLKKAGLL